MLKAFRVKSEVGSDHDDSRKLSGRRAYLTPEFLIKGLKGKFGLPADATKEERQQWLGTMNNDHQ